MTEQDDEVPPVPKELQQDVTALLNCHNPYDVESLYQKIDEEDPTFWHSACGQKVIQDCLIAYTRAGFMKMLEVALTKWDADANVIASFLAEVGVDVFHENEAALIALVQHAAFNGMTEFFNYLLVDKKISIPKYTDAGHHPAICTAAINGHVELLKFFVDHYGAHIIDRPCMSTNQSLLLHSSIGGQVQAMRWMVQNFNVIPEQDALNVAAQYGRAYVCQFLLSECNVSVGKIFNLVRALHVACGALSDEYDEPEEDMLATIKVLVEAGANVNGKDSNGKLPVDHARKQGWRQIVEYLTGSDDDDGPAFVRKSQKKIWSLLVSESVAAFSRRWETLDKRMVSFFKSSPLGETSLYKALEHHAADGRIDMLRCLFERFVRDLPSNEPAQYALPLIAAIEHGHEEIALYLIQEAKADIFLVDSDEGRSPLARAIDADMVNLVKYVVVEKGVKVQEPFEDGHTGFCMAARGGSLKVLTFFMEHFGRDIIEWPCPKEGLKLLPLAAINNQCEAIRWLINEAGADPLRAYEDGCNALHICAVVGVADACQALLTEGIPVNLTSVRGSSALHYACASAPNPDDDESEDHVEEPNVDHFAVVRLLVEAGADRRALDDNGKAPLFYAIQQKHYDIVDYLTREDRQAVADAAMAELLAEEDKKKKGVQAKAGGGGGSGAGGSSSKPKKKKQQQKKKKAGVSATSDGKEEEVKPKEEQMEKQEEQLEEVIEAMAGGGGMNLQQAQEMAAQEEEGEAVHPHIAAEVPTPGGDDLEEQQEHRQEQVEQHVQNQEQEDEDEEEEFLLKGAPDDMTCPICFKLMTDPVMAPDGRTYQRAALQGFIDYAAENNRELRSPMTGEPMVAMYFPNINFKSLVFEYIEKRRKERDQERAGGGAAAGPAQEAN